MPRTAPPADGNAGHQANSQENRALPGQGERGRPPMLPVPLQVMARGRFRPHNRGGAAGRRVGTAGRCRESRTGVTLEGNPGYTLAGDS